LSYNLNNKLVVAISSRALFDLEIENKIFEQKGLDEYYKYQLKNKDKPLLKGTGYRLIENLLKINTHFSEDEKIIEVIILSKNNASMSLRITNAINEYKLDIIRSGWTSGKDISTYLKAFKVDLFLSADDKDVINAIKNNIASAKILHSKEDIHTQKDNQVNIAFDGDAVLFSEESELIYKKEGLEAFVKYEQENKNNPLQEGVFAKFLKALSAIQKKFPDEQSPIRTAIITARSAPSHERVINTLNIWDIKIDEIFFLGGSEKAQILRAFGADIFFDDQDIHLDIASNIVPSAKVINEKIEAFEK
jgi:5'-nucleotidase